MKKPLLLAERLLLLALRDDKGTVVSSSSIALPYGLAGAVILDLAARGFLNAEKKSVTVLRDGRAGDEVLDAAIASIRDSKGVRKLNYWVARPDSLVKGLKQRLLDRLVDRGILRREEHHFLWLIPYNRYPEANGEPERGIRQKVHDAVLHGAKADEPTALLISLIGACDLAKEVFPHRKTREVKKQLKLFGDRDCVTSAVTGQVVAATTAVIVGAIAGSTAAAASG